MSNVIFQSWLFVYLFLFAIGPLFVWKSRSLVEKISARNPDWITADTPGSSGFPGPQMRSWLRIMSGKYAGLDQDLQGSCRVFRVWSIVYLVCLFAALAGAAYFIFFEG
ncbi:MAG TPA: hypothetical protein VGT99_13500 [Gammaproteobacteria bacterium]|nr:hypothetical protein [Gammaproteobacteria bacterium]